MYARDNRKLAWKIHVSRSIHVSRVSHRRYALIPSRLLQGYLTVLIVLQWPEHGPLTRSDLYGESRKKRNFSRNGSRYLYEELRLLYYYYKRKPRKLVLFSVLATIKVFFLPMGC